MHNHTGACARVKQFSRRTHRGARRPWHGGRTRPQGSYLWIFQSFAPVIEQGGIATIILAACLGALSPRFCVEFLIFGYVFATVISIGCVLQEEITYRRYNDWQDALRLVSYCFLEHFPYRQFHMIWRLQGAWQYMRGDVAWRPMKRQGLESSRAR